MKLEEKHELHRLDGIDFTVAEDFSKLMQPFNQCFKILQADKTPTVHLVAMWFSRLYDRMQVKDEDSDLIKRIKSEAQPLFSRYITADEFYLAACLMNPS